jgi:hypothetical protein
MGTPDEMINIVRAALAPGADAATKQQAGVVLRALLAAIETSPGASLAGTVAVAPIGVPSAADIFGAIVEKLRPHLPADAPTTIPRLNIPLVPLPKP